MAPSRLGSVLAVALFVVPGAGPAAEPARADSHGDPLPDEARARLGTIRLRHGGKIRSAAFTPDGRTLLSDGEDGVRVWDLANGREVRHLLPDGPGTGVYLATLSSDGKTVAMIGIGGGTLGLWDVASGRRLHDLGRRPQALTLRFSPDGKQLAVGLGNAGVELWDTTTGKLRHTLKATVGYPFSVAFTPDGKTMYTFGAVETVGVWDVATGAWLRDIRGCPNIVHLLALAPDGKQFATIGLSAAGAGIPRYDPDNYLRFWDAESGKEIRRLDVPTKKAADGRQEGLCYAGYLGDGKTLLTAAEDGTARVWDVASGKELRQFVLPQRLTVYSELGVAPDGKSAAGVAGHSALRVIDLGSGKDRVPLGGHEGDVFAALLSPDGRTAYTSGHDRTVRAWDAATGAERHRLSGDEQGTAALALARDGRTLFAANAAGRVTAWDVAAARPERRWQQDLPATTHPCVALSPDGKTFASSSALGDTATGKERQTLQQLAGMSFLGSAFVGDGRALAAWARAADVGPLHLHVWDAGTGRLLRGQALDTFSGPQQVVSPVGVALSPDGRLLAEASPSQFIGFHDVATGKAVRRLDNLKDVPESLAFSPDGRTLVWGGVHDPSLRLVELASGRERGRLVGHRGRATSLRFSADGRTLVSGSTDATALVWDLTGRLRAKEAWRLPPPADEVETCWAALSGGDAARAYQALRRLADAPSQAVPLIRQRLRPAAGTDEKRVAALIADLDSDEFAVREKATADLEKVGEGAVAACRKALASAPSAEARRRLELFLEKQAKAAWDAPPERLRETRALEALELAGTAEARALLKELAAGVAGAWLTEEAKAASERLARRSSQ